MPAGHGPNNAEDASSRHRSRQDSRVLRAKKSLTEIGSSIVSNMFNRPRSRSARNQSQMDDSADNASQDAQAPAPVGRAYEGMESREHEGQQVDGGIQYPDPIADRRRQSALENLARRLTFSEVRSRRQSNAQPEAQDVQQRQSSQPEQNDAQEVPASVPMERSLAQSRWRTLKSQISLPNLGKRKHSSGSENRSRSRRRGTFHVVSVTLMHPPDNTAQDYQRAMGDVHGPDGEALRPELEGDSPFRGMYELEGEPLSSASHDPNCTCHLLQQRTVDSNMDALAALEGYAPVDHGQDYNEREFAQAYSTNVEAVEEFIRTWGTRGMPRAIARDDDDDDTLENFSSEQKRTFAYLLAAEDPRGFEDYGL